MPVKDKKTLLIVEDEILIALAKQNELKEYGYNVLTVNTGEKAVAVSKENKDIDLILMDIDLGRGIDGTEAAEIILKSRNLPILFLSSHTEPEIVEKTEKISSFGYVVKNSSISVCNASIKMAFKLFDANKKIQMINSRLNINIENMPNAYIQWDLNLNVVEWNKEAEKIFGYSKKEMLGKNPVNYIVPKRDRTVVKEVLKKLHIGEIADYSAKNNNITKDGNFISCQWVNTPLVDNEGLVFGFITIAQDITARIIVEDEFKKSANMLNDVLNTIPVRVFWKDLNGVYLGCNKLFAEDAGKSNPEEVIGDIDYNMGWAEQAELYRKDDRDVIKSGQPKINYEELVPTPEGKVNWVNTSKIPLRNNKGSIYGMLGTYENITKRKEMERSLSEANSIINRSSTVALLWKNGKNWPVEFATENVESLCGFTAQEFKEKKILYSNIIYSEDHTRVAEEVKFFSQKDGINSFTHKPYRIITKNKETKWVTDTTYIRRDSQGIITHYEGIITDITNRIQMEEKLRLRELRYESIFQENQAVILLIDPDNANIADANPAACQFYGWTYEEITSKKITDINLMNPEELYSSLALIRKDKQKHFFFRHRLASGEFRDVEVYAGLINIENKELLYSLIHDITDRKIAENKLNHQLLEKEIILKEVHHRIKNNLASVGSLLSLQAQAATNPEVKSALQDAIGRVDSMHVLYNKLLLTKDYKVTSTREYFNNLIDDVIGIFSNSIEISVDKRIDDFQLDPKQLVPVGIIVNELLTNIMKYGFTNQTSGLIKIILKEKQGKVSLTIQDNGIGLPDKFDINTTEGFGLMLIKLLTEQLDGSFKIDNHVGTKSTLEFSI